MSDGIQIEREIKTYLLKEEYESTLSAYKETINSQDSKPDVHELIGNAYVKMSNLENAIHEYFCAINLYENKGLFENGVAVCKKILRISPYNKTVYFNLAWFYAKLGLLNELTDSLIIYLRLSKDKKELQNEPKKYRSIMSLITNDESLKSRLNEVFGFDPDGFAQYIDGYNKVKELLIKGFGMAEIKAATGFDDDLIEKYQEIANLHLTMEAESEAR